MKVRQIIKEVKKSPAILSFLFVICLVLIMISSKEYNASSIIKNNDVQRQDAYEVMAPKTVTVKLERVYLDGDISEELMEETIWSMEDFWAHYEEWDLVDQNEEQIHFRKLVDDISPLLKINGYFGISEDGYLNIYEGKPDDENVIQSFFQINTEKLKSHQHFHLKEGIPVQSTENYKEVIQTFKKYAVTQM